MKYKAIEQTVQAVQITADIDMIAPDWFAKKMNTEEIMIDRVQKDGATAVIGCTVYFNARRYKGSRLVARIGDYVVKDSVEMCIRDRQNREQKSNRLKQTQEHLKRLML